MAARKGLVNPVLCRHDIIMSAEVHRDDERDQRAGEKCRGGVASIESNFKDCSAFVFENNILQPFHLRTSRMTFGGYNSGSLVRIKDIINKGEAVGSWR